MGFDKLLRVKHLSWHVVVRTAKHVNLRPRGKGRKLAVGREFAAAQFLHQHGRAGLKLGHVGKVDVQTYVFTRCILEGTSMKTYDYFLLLHERMRKFSIANMTTSDWRRFKGPPAASEWTFGSAGKDNAVQNRS